MEPERGVLAREKTIEAFYYDGLDRFTPDLVSWNGAGFDMPVLHYRSLLHSVPAARYWETGDEDSSFRYNNYLGRFHWRHMDLMDILSAYQGRGRVGLDAVATLLGFPGKLGMDGSQVWEAWQRGEAARIRAYCETDVINTYLVYLRFELIRGRLTPAEHRAEEARLRELLRHSRQVTEGIRIGVARPLNITDTASIVDLAEDGRSHHPPMAARPCSWTAPCPGNGCVTDWSADARQFDEAALEEVLEPSPHRVRPACPHFGLCGGCSLQHLDAAAQLDVKQGQLLNALERIGGVRPREVLAPLRGPPWAYRRRARLGVRHVRKKQRVLAGFRERLSPYLADLAWARCWSPSLGEIYPRSWRAWWAAWT
ncbi:MAG: ribonuclease H-like domain-containing protein [Steroidobacteraceae bacterium]